MADRAGAAAGPRHGAKRACPLMQPERTTMKSPSRHTSLTLTGKVQPMAAQIINAQSRGRSFLCPAFPLTESASQYVVVEADGNYTHSQNSDIRFSQGDRIGQWDCHQGVLLLSTNASQSRSED